MRNYIKCNKKILTDFLKKHDYYVMFSINFNAKQELYESVILTNKMLRNINRAIYNNNYVNKNKYVDGFAVIEKNHNHFKDKYHMHLLLINDDKLCSRGIDTFLELAIKSSCKLKDNNNIYAFNHSDIDVVYNNGVSSVSTTCMHVVKPYNENACEYITKTIRDNNTDDVLLLSANGLIASDNYYNKY